MDSFFPLPIVIVMVAAVVAGFTDARSFRVPNLLTIPLMTSGLFYHWWVGGWMGLGVSLLGLVFGFALLLLFFVTGGIGAGDVKLMAGVGAWLGVYLTLWVFIAAAVASGLYAVYLMIYHGRVWATLANLKVVCHRLAAVGRYLGGDRGIEDGLPVAERRKYCIPFAAMMAVGMGGLLALCWLVQQP